MTRALRGAQQTAADNSAGGSDQASANSSPVPSSETKPRRPFKWYVIAAVVILGGGLILYICNPESGCMARSLAEGVECLKREGHIPGDATALRGVEPGTLLGYTESGTLNRNAPCYGGTLKRQGLTHPQLRIDYEDARQLSQDLSAVKGVKGGLKLQNGSSTSLLLRGLSVSKTTGVYDPLSSCKPDVHKVVVWELRAETATLVSQQNGKVELDLSAEHEENKVGTAVDKSGITGARVTAKGVVIAYMTRTLKTNVWPEVTSWTGDVMAEPSVKLPQPAELHHGLRLRVTQFDRRAPKPVLLRLSGSPAMASECAGDNQRAAMLNLSLELNYSCAVDINDATRLLIETEFAGNKLEIKTSLYHTTQQGSGDDVQK